MQRARVARRLWEKKGCQAVYSGLAKMAVTSLRLWLSS
ncbi:hypothetical protein HMPREF1246_2181 [Acidaminococcus sp. BV3L6]|nr:hypothetical protein HMPREF1246_2181 [Acidaminococcus sp. BV3L6]